MWMDIQGMQGECVCYLCGFFDYFVRDCIDYGGLGFGFYGGFYFVMFGFGKYFDYFCNFFYSKGCVMELMFF